MFFHFETISGYPAVLYYCQGTLWFFIILLLNMDFRVFGSFMRFFRQELDCTIIDADWGNALVALQGFELNGLVR